MNRRIYASTLFLVLLLAGLMAAPATAQQTAAPEANAPESPWIEHFGEQARLLLETGDAERQEEALQFILTFSQHAEKDINFAPAIPALFDVYESAEDEGLRLLALSALQAVGSEDDFKRLAEHVQFESSDRVRRQALRMLTVRQQNADPLTP